LAVQKEIRDLRGQMQDKATSQRLEVLKILTPEQQKKFKSYRPGGMRGGAGWYGRSGKGYEGTGKKPLQLLERRYAKGEVTKQEFERSKKNFHFEDVLLKFLTYG